MIFIGLSFGLVCSAAYAWECETNPPCGCDWADGSQLTYRINVSDFNAAGQADIQLAGNAWDAGPGKINRGANWNFIRGPNITSDGAIGDGANQVYKKPNSWWVEQGFPDQPLAGVRHTHFACGRNDADIIFNSGYRWTTSVPSEAHGAPTIANGGRASLGHVAMHEFGHVLGLAHENSYLATMNEHYPNGGEIGSVRHRISEDDFVGLVAGKGGTSTGTNLMISKFSNFGTSGIERWDEWEGSDWTTCPGGNIPSVQGPFGVSALITGTATTLATIEWRLSGDAVCTATDPLLATRNVNLGVGAPANDVRPVGGYTAPTNINLGEYYLCAEIMPQGPIVETSAADNIVVSEKKFKVEGLCF